MRESIFPADGIRRALAAICLIAASLSASAQGWETLRKDGIHDPRGPAVKQLQEPGEALSKLAPDNAGNMVRWIKALEQGQINPRANLRPDTKIRIYDSDVLLNLKGGMPIVRFPHRQHTLWLDCVNCHDHLFKAEAGANKLSMLAILEGEQCGVCHGAVAFPLTECFRCHSVPRPGQIAPRPTLPIAIPTGAVPPR
jgi:c(7)-type cytochrome triheme protein